MSKTYKQFPLTNFPESTDEETFDIFLDMEQSDFELVKKYQIALEDGDDETAESYLSQIPNHSQKLINATRLNSLRDMIFAMEKFYGSDIESYVASKQTEWETYINRFDYINEWNSTQNYEKYNIVKFTDNGLSKLYLNISDIETPLNTTPYNTSFWRVLTVQGQKGDKGIGTSFYFDWDGSLTYTKDSVVVYNNSWWIANQESLNQQPSEDSIYWDIVLTAIQSIYPVTETQPTSQEDGELWFQELGVR